MSGKRKIISLKVKQAVTIRLILIFVFASLIGALLTKNSSYAASCFDSIQYKTSIAKSNAFEFLQLSISSCIKLFLCFAISSISAMTFFCSPTIHGITVFYGVLCGIRIGVLVNCGFLSSHFAPAAIWIALALVIAILLCLGNVYFLNIHKQFLFSRKPHYAKGKIYVSPLIKNWASNSIIMAITYFLIWTLGSMLIYITL